MSAAGAPWIVVTGLDGSGKSSLVRALARAPGGHVFHLPYHRFVKRYLAASKAQGPFANVHTDRLVFAADARMTSTLIGLWRQQHGLLISQRGWMDNYVFGAVQGVSYEATDGLLRTAELERAAAIISLVAHPDVAFERIRHDPEGDKYETAEFLRDQHLETLGFHAALRAELPVLAPFAGIPEIIIDTTAKRPVEVAREARSFLSSVLPSLEQRSTLAGRD